MDEGGTQTNWPKNEEIDDKALLSRDDINSLCQELEEEEDSSMLRIV